MNIDTTNFHLVMAAFGERSELLLHDTLNRENVMFWKVTNKLSTFRECYNFVIGVKDSVTGCGQSL